MFGVFVVIAAGAAYWAFACKPAEAVCFVPVVSDAQLRIDAAYAVQANNM